MTGVYARTLGPRQRRALEFIASRIDRGMGFPPSSDIACFLGRPRDHHTATDILYSLAAVGYISMDRKMIGKQFRLACTLLRRIDDDAGTTNSSVSSMENADRYTGDCKDSKPGRGDDLEQPDSHTDHSATNGGRR